MSAAVAWGADGSVAIDPLHIPPPPGIDPLLDNLHSAFHLPVRQPFRHGNRTYLGPPSSIPSRFKEHGIVGEDNTLRFLVHVRVRNGRGECPNALHPLVEVSPTETYTRYGGRWYCDVCGKAGKPGESMHHCSKGCEYDLCTSCARARERAMSLRSRSKRNSNSNGGGSSSGGGGSSNGQWPNPPNNGLQSPNAQQGPVMQYGGLPASGGWAGF